MRIFGIDAGFTAAGFAVVETSQGPYGKILHAECYQTARTPPKKRKSVTEDDARRIVELVSRMQWIASQFSPDAIVMELPTGGARGAGAIKGMAFSTGTTITAAHFLKIPFAIINPFQNKVASTGKTHGDKAEVMRSAEACWPGIVWPKLKNGKIDYVRSEAIADALSCILARIKGLA